MINRIPALALCLLLLWACNAPGNEAKVPATPSFVQVAGAMKNVMWKGKLGGSIKLDTITGRDHLFALGPESYLRGEIMAVDGEVFVSRVVSDSTMSVEVIPDITAPFLVYASVDHWQEIGLPAAVKSIQDLEKFLDTVRKDLPHPFVFRLNGSIAEAIIHVQNLAPGTKVSSPKEAHQGQVKYPLGNTEASIIGFFSTGHQGVFTHHDTYLHMHLLSADRAFMGHVDELTIEDMKLYVSP